MMMSPGSISAASWSITLPVMPAGIMTQATRGVSSLATNSSSVRAPAPPSASRAATFSSVVSNPTTVWPSFMIRRAMPAPIRPKPIKPSCISDLSSGRTRGRISCRRAIAADQCVGGAVVLQVGLGVRAELTRDLLGQHLAELDAPLVEGVDGPHRALGEHAVLVERDEGTECERGELVEQECVGRAVAVEDLVRDERGGHALGRDLLGGLAERERLALGEDVGVEQIVMALPINCAERVERVGEADEVDRDEVRALVDQLVEAVLTVRARLAPVNRAGGVG